MFRVLFLSVTIYLFSIVMIWGSVPSKPELGESREDQSVCIERTWVCGQVGSVVRHPPCDECVHWVQGGTVTSFYLDTGTMKTHHVEGLEMCASCRPAASPERGRRGGWAVPPSFLFPRLLIRSGTCLHLRRRAGGGRASNLCPFACKHGVGMSVPQHKWRMSIVIYVYHP